MTHTWSTIPLLPLTCILEHLSSEDAFAAMSTCRHWRNATLLYEGRRELLKLNVRQFEKCMYTTRIFRRYVQRLHIYIDCNDSDTEKFMKFIFPLYFDTTKLYEIIFIGPSYVQQSNHLPFITLRRIMIEALVFKNIKNLMKLGFMGCGMAPVKNEHDRYSHKQVEVYSKPLKFCSVLTAADTILSSTNIHMMQYSTITHIVVDYEQINTAALKTLSHLRNFAYISLNITNKRLRLAPVDWVGLRALYNYQLRVTVNIIAVPFRRFDDIMRNVLVEGMWLISLKVMFCKSLYTPLLSHVSRLFQNTLIEVLWADSPYDSNDPYHRVVRPLRQEQPDTYAHVNPFVLLCWQCMNLKRLAIHGYWIWQYDVLGFVRLRKDLQHLEVSAIYHKQDQFNRMLQFSEEGALRVLSGDIPPPLCPEFVEEINGYTDYTWRPVPWQRLHPALRSRATTSNRVDFVVHEARLPMGTPQYSK